MLVALKDKSERGETDVRGDPAPAPYRQRVPGIQIFFQPIQNINIGGRLAKSQYQYTLQSNDTDALYQIAPEMREKMTKLSALSDVAIDLYIKNPQMSVEVDREQASAYGVTVDQVRQELYNAFGSRQVATIYTPAMDYPVILESQPQFQADPSALSKIYLKTSAVNVNKSGRRRASAVSAI